MPFKRPSRNRNRNSSDSDRQEPQRQSVDPDDGEKSGSLIWTISNGLRSIFSHKGAFWLGVAVATLAFGFNWYFYFSILMEKSGLQDWQAVLCATIISCFTTLFELIPVVWAIGYQNRLHQIFQEASKPTLLPELSKKTTNADDLLKAYRNSDRETRDFFKAMRWTAIAFEVCIGVLFLGAVGAGLNAALSLCLFVASIFGCEWGVSMALRSANWELPPQIQQQLNSLINRFGKPLDLKNL